MSPGCWALLQAASGCQVPEGASPRLPVFLHDAAVALSHSWGHRASPRTRRPGGGQSPGRSQRCGREWAPAACPPAPLRSANPSREPRNQSDGPASSRTPPPRRAWSPRRCLRPGPGPPRALPLGALVRAQPQPFPTSRARASLAPGASCARLLRPAASCARLLHPGGSCTRLTRLPGPRARAPATGEDVRNPRRVPEKRPARTCPVK